MTKQTLLLLFGGPSSEHDVSLMSAKNISKLINRNDYNVIFGYVDKSGDWWLDESVSAQADQRIVIDEASKQLTVGGQPVDVDIAFAAMHGNYGEDGTVQAIFESLGVDYVGCGVDASALCMDKQRTKQLLDDNQVLTTPYLVLQSGQTLPSYDDLARQLNSAVLFVKPANGGSSIGVSKVTNEANFGPAVQNAFGYDYKILVEKALVGREIEIAVLGNSPDLTISLPGEITTGAEFYDYEDKYSDDRQSDIVIYPELDPAIKTKIQQAAGKIYQLLGCRGLARVDFILVGDELYLNEVNTMPGFTNSSMYPKLIEASGISQQQLVAELIKLAARDR